MYVDIVTINSTSNDIKDVTEFHCDCINCGEEFSPKNSIISLIDNILAHYAIKKTDLPYLKMPDSAWEHPGLLSECPNCGEKLKFNPFITGVEEY
jgi:hypothetical protein